MFRVYVIGGIGEGVARDHGCSGEYTGDVLGRKGEGKGRGRS